MSSQKRIRNDTNDTIQKKKSFIEEHVTSFLDLINDIVLYIITIDLNLWLFNTLLRTCKTMNNTLSINNSVEEWKEMFKKRYLSQKVIMIKDHLQSLNILSLFNQLNNENGALISGEYLTYCLSDIAFHNGKIRIFIAYPEEYNEDLIFVYENARNEIIASYNVYIPMIEDYICEVPMVKALLERIQNFTKEIMIKCINCNEYNTFFNVNYISTGPYIRRKNVIRSIIRLGMINGPKIKIIMVSVKPEETIHQVVNNSWNFSFCKSTFDGKEIQTNNLFDQIRKVGHVSSMKVDEGKYNKSKDMVICNYLEKHFENYEKKGYSIKKPIN